MPPDHGHFSGCVNLDDAEPVMRELASPILPYHPAEQAPGTI